MIDHRKIRAAYPAVVFIKDTDVGVICYDESMNSIDIDYTYIEDNSVGVVDLKYNKSEYNWSKSEIEKAAIQLSKCEFAETYPLDNMATCTGTSEEWRQYIIRLRYYATYNETDGYSLRLDERPIY